MTLYCILMLGCIEICSTSLATCGSGTSRSFVPCIIHPLTGQGERNEKSYEFGNNPTNFSKS